MCIGLQTFKAGVDQMMFWGFDNVFDFRYTSACQRKIETLRFFETSMYTPNSSHIRCMYTRDTSVAKVVNLKLHSEAKKRLLA